MIEIGFAVSVALNVCFAAVLLKVALTGFSKLSESHERTTRYTEGLIDRLMANDYTTYQDRQLSQAMALYRNNEPSIEEQDDFRATRGPDRGGFGSQLGLLALSHNEDSDSEELVSELIARSDL